MEDIINEARAMFKLCGYGFHENLISVLRWGKLDQSPYYYFDMELCDFNLNDYIQGKPLPEFFPQVLKTVISASEMRLSNLWNIMEQIAKGVEFIHMNNEVHRDLKPSNSTASFLDQQRNH